jgi:hypothetical protein
LLSKCDLVLEFSAGNESVSVHFLFLFLPLGVRWVEGVKLLFKHVVEEVLILLLNLIHSFSLFSDLSHLFLLQGSIFGLTLSLNLFLFLVEFLKVFLNEVVPLVVVNLETLSSVMNDVSATQSQARALVAY